MSENSWDTLTSNQRYDFIAQALYLIDHGYIDHKVSVESLAQRLFMYETKKKGEKDGV